MRCDTTTMVPEWPGVRRSPGHGPALSTALGLLLVLAACATPPGAGRSKDPGLATQPSRPPRALVRHQGPEIPLAPRDLSDAVLFPGQGEGASFDDALRSALANARAEAVSSIRSDVKREFHGRVREERKGDEVGLERRLEERVEILAEGSLENTRQEGEPRIEEYSDGSFVVTVQVRVPRTELDARVFLERGLELQAGEEIRSGRPKRALQALDALLLWRPADPLLFVRLARVEEQLARTDPSHRARALESLRKALSANGGKSVITDPDHPGATLDLASEIDRLTPHWEELLAHLARLEEQTRDREGFSIDSAQESYSRRAGDEVLLRLHAAAPRDVALLWIDGEGLFPLDSFAGAAAEGRFTRLDGLQTVSLDLGTINGPVTVWLMAAGGANAVEAVLGDVSREKVVAHEQAAVEAVHALRGWLDGELRAGRLKVASTRFEIVP